MKFDSNQAWQQATAAVSANFSMLLPIAGVFFLVPSLVSTWFFGDMQAAMLANIANPQANEAMVQGMIGKFAGFGLAAMLVQSVGNMALLGLLTDRARPTVGEAIGNAVKSLPTVIGAIVLFIVAYFVVALVAGIVIGGAAAGLGKRSPMPGFGGSASGPASTGSPRIVRADARGFTGSTR